MWRGFRAMLRSPQKVFGPLFLNSLYPPLTYLNASSNVNVFIFIEPGSLRDRLSGYFRNVVY